MFDASELANLGADLQQAADSMPRHADTVVRRSGVSAQAIAVSNAPWRTGYHRSTIGWDSLGLGKIEFGPTSNYGAHLEYGTSRMAPRPHIGPAIDAVVPSVANNLTVIGAALIGNPGGLP